jgi:hypothetical protein
MMRYFCMRLQKRICTGWIKSVSLKFTVQDCSVPGGILGIEHKYITNGNPLQLFFK